MTIALLFINIFSLLLILVLIRAVVVLNDKLDIVKKDQNDFHQRNAELWKENATILRNNLN
jgi:hypothetical protein